MSNTGEERLAKVAEVHRILLEVYGEPNWRPHLDPVSELVSTILSQNTNDVNRDVAYERLRDRFPTWEQLWVLVTVGQFPAQNLAMDQKAQ